MTPPGGRGSVRAAFSGSDGASPSRDIQTVILHAGAGDTNPKRKRGRQTIASFTLRVSMGCLIADRAKYSASESRSLSPSIDFNREGVRDGGQHPPSVASRRCDGCPFLLMSEREPDAELQEKAHRQRQYKRARLHPGSQQPGFDANRYRRSLSACRPYNRTCAFAVTYCWG
jgi:hypothetical protein